MASEWLDNIPLDVAELGIDGPRLVLVDPGTGAERTGPAVSGTDLAWQRRWWPLGQPGERAELGHPRCAAWADVIGRLDRGLALAADYGHRLGSRPACGTIAGYLDGRPVRPIPDGSRDITAHVAIDACAAAGIAAGASQTVLTTQRAALRALGLTGCRPPLSQASADPAGYLARLRQAAEEAELTDPAGFGAFSWLVQAVGMPLPGPLQRLAPGGRAGPPAPALTEQGAGMTGPVQDDRAGLGDRAGAGMTGQLRRAEAVTSPWAAGAGHAPGAATAAGPPAARPGMARSWCSTSVPGTPRGTACCGCGWCWTATGS